MGKAHIYPKEKAKVVSFQSPNLFSVLGDEGEGEEEESLVGHSALVTSEKFQPTSLHAPPPPRAQGKQSNRLGTRENISPSNPFTATSLTPPATSSSSPTSPPSSSPSKPSSPSPSPSKPLPSSPSLPIHYPTVSPFSNSSPQDKIPKSPKCKGRALDLFSGTGSVAQRLQGLGYQVVTLDLDYRTKPKISQDLLQWDYTIYPPGHFRIISASVPCAEYSLAKTTAPRNFARADALVSKVLEIVEYFSPKSWWIENPRTGHLKTRPMVKSLPFVDIDYCQFSDWGYQKPTRFWGSPNLGLLAHVRCPGKKCLNMVVDENGMHHRERLGGNAIKFNTAMKGRVPSKVVDYLLQEGEYAPSGKKKGVKSYRFKGYKVDPKIREKLISVLGVEREKVLVDLFASPSDAQERFFMTEANSAWFYDWGNFCQDGQVLWANLWANV